MIKKLKQRIFLLVMLSLSIVMLGIIVLYAYLNYTNTIKFIKAIDKVRIYYSLDDIFIYAGACGSNAESLIAAGANFASSFDRNNIEAYDPAIVAIMAAITPINQIIDIDDIYNYSKMDKGSIGGVESYGKMRLLLS